jgi:CheY-like chemotaxis protein
MGGTIHIDSAPGLGTTVSIVIPYEAAGEDLVQTLAGVQGMPRGIRDGVRPRILVVDDNAVNVDFLADLLQMTGFQVRGCHHVDEALATFAAEGADLIITDLVMPDRDGFDLIQAVRTGSKAPATPIIVASASAFPGDQVRAMAVGASEFLPKPVDSLMLLQKMAALLKIDYLADEPAEAAEVPASSLKALLDRPGARELIGAIRDAAELGQIRRVESLIDESEDNDLQHALRVALALALREQDADLVLQLLDRAEAAS